MKKHAIIPIFIPHRGCPNDCVFCNQRKITARTDDVTPEDARRIIDTWLKTLRPCPEEVHSSSVKQERDVRECQNNNLENHENLDNMGIVEVAFYGGSFTGLPIEEQSAFLAVALEYKLAAKVDKIHLSTRPDYIDEEILDNLRRFQVDTIELGVQSFDDDVLLKSNRGHNAADVERAVDLIKRYGFELGIQLMIGLPGDSLETCVYSARRTAEIGPSLARLYPTIVLDDTKLKEMYRRGEYEPLSREEAVKRTLEMYKILAGAGIKIMRVGLKSTELIGEGGAINGGTYHPAFRQLVEGKLARERINAKLEKLHEAEMKADAAKLKKTPQSLPSRHITVDIYSNGKWFSNMIGHEACNKKYWGEKYPAFKLRYHIDNSLEDADFRIEPASANQKED